jgi:DNA polymerase III alpha subunit
LYPNDSNCRQIFCPSCDYRYPVNVKHIDIRDNGIVCPNCGAIEVFYEEKGRLPKKYRNRKFDKRYLKKHIFGFSSEECQLKQFADVIIKERCMPLSIIDLKEENETVRIAFEVRKIKQIVDKNSNQMAFLDITDGEYETSLTIFSSDWEDLKPYIKEGGCYAGMLVKNRGKVLFSSRNQCYLKRLVSSYRGS